MQLFLGSFRNGARQPFLVTFALEKLRGHKINMKCRKKFIIGEG